MDELNPVRCSIESDTVFLFDNIFNYDEFLFDFVPGEGE